MKNKYFMKEKLGFWKRTWKVIKALFEFITLYFFVIMTLMFFGDVVLGRR